MNKIKTKKHACVCVLDAGKKFDKTLHSFMIKILSFMITYLNATKVIYNKPTSSRILSEEKLKAFLIRSKKQKRMSIVNTAFQYSSEAKAEEKKQQKESRGYILKKEEVKLFLFTNNLNFCRGNEKNSRNTPVEWMGQFRNVPKHKFNTLKSISFIHTCNVLLEKGRISCIQSNYRK